MKQIAIALAAIGIATAAFSSLPASTDPTLVNVPQLPGGFFVGGYLGYLQPISTNGDLDYATANFSTGSLFFSELRSARPSFDYAWGANVGYEFPFAARDINLKYFHFDINNTEAIFSFPFSITPIGFNLITIPDNFMTIAERTQYDLNQFDLLAGQTLDVGCRLVLHPNAGLRWTDFERRITTNDFQPLIFLLPLFNDVLTDQKSNFDGVGPIVGLDASYYLGTGIGVVAHLDSALLVGDIDSKLDATAVVFTPLVGTDAIIKFNFKNESQHRVVPVLDGKLGVDYTYLFNCFSNAYITAEVGYQVSEYFNLIDRLYGTATVESLAVPNLTQFILPNSAQITERRTADFSLSGPYVNLTLHV